MLLCSFPAALWAFSPAYPTYLEALVSAADYWKVVGDVNMTLASAKAGCGVGDARENATSVVAEQLKDGNLAALTANTRELAYNAQVATQAREAAMIQVCCTPGPACLSVFLSARLPAVNCALCVRNRFGNSCFK